MVLGNIRFESIKYKEENPWFCFPIIQRVFAKTLASDLVSVQPLSAPTGLLNYGYMGHNERWTITIPTSELSEDEKQEYITLLRNSLREEVNKPTFETLSFPKTNRTFT